MTLKGMDGAAQIQAMMTKMRENAPKKIGDHEVLALRDYKNDVRTDLATGKTEPTGLPIRYTKILRASDGVLRSYLREHRFR